MLSILTLHKLIQN